MKVKCPKCGKEYNTTLYPVGTEITCTSCENSFVIGSEKSIDADKATEVEPADREVRLPTARHLLILWAVTYVVANLPNPSGALPGLIIGWMVFPFSFVSYLFGDDGHNCIGGSDTLIVICYYVLLIILHIMILIFRKWWIFGILAVILIVSAAGCSETFIDSIK